jgi:hypothetical protein
LAGSANHVITRCATPISRSFTAIASRERKCCCTKFPMILPIRSFCLPMIAVWGIGMPRGCRKMAVTANQSASPPTTEASAVARIYPSHG